MVRPGSRRRADHSKNPLDTNDAWIEVTDWTAHVQQAITANTDTTNDKGHFFLWENSSGQNQMRVGLTVVQIRNRPDAPPAGIAGRAS